MTAPEDEGVSGTATGPSVPREDERAAEQHPERVAVPRFDVVTAPVEGLGEAASDLAPGEEADAARSDGSPTHDMESRRESAREGAHDVDRDNESGHG